MHRLIDYSTEEIKSNSRRFCLVSLLVLLSLFASIFSDVGLRVHAATGSSLKNIQGSGNHHLNSHQQSAAKFSPGHQVNANLPDLTLTRANSPVTLSHGKHVIDYVLSVSNGHSAGSVSAGNTIIISNVIPASVTNITVHARSSDWKVKLAAKIGPSLLTATYVGVYPIRAGARLSPLIIHGILLKNQAHHVFLPAVVRLVHSNFLKKNSARLLQQQAVHDFTVRSVASKPAKPLVNPTYQVGQTISYTLSINNDSAAGALLTGDTVTVTDSIPVGLTGLTVSASSSDWTVSLGGTTSPTTLTATYVGSYPILPGATFSPIVVVGTLTTTAIPQIVNTAVAVTPNDINAANNSGTNTINVVAQPDLTVTDPVPSGTTFEVGKPVTYILTGSSLSSAGPVFAGDAITITDTIPAGLTGITATDSSGQWNLSLSATSGPVTLTATYIGTYPVAAGTTFPPITITGTLTSAALPNLANSATISTPKDSNAANNTASNTITVVPQPDLTLTKTVPGGTYQVGRSVTYTLTASNASGVGPVLAGYAITVTDAIPTGLTAMTASGTNWTVSLGATTSPTTLTATYTGAYPVNAGTSLPTIALSGTLTATSPPQVVNSATVTTPNDGNNANNSGSNTLPVLTAPDLTVTDPVPSGTTFEVGKPVTYTVTGSSLGSGGPVLAGDAITITDTIPAGLTGITATDSSGKWNLSLSATSGLATLTATYIGTYPVAAGTTLPPITITGTLTSAALPNLANTATISTPKDSNAANNTASNTIAVVAQPDLTIAKTVPGGITYQVGGSVTYTLTASNASGVGPVLTGDAITITDSIPAGLTGLTASGTNWTVTLGATTSPTTLTATYIGAYPVNAGTSLPTITLSGTLTATSPPQVVNSVTVTTPNDGNNANNSGSNTLPVLIAPDLTVTDPVPSGTTFEVGKPVTYTVTGSSLISGGSVLAGDAIIITDTIPAGLTGITATDSTGKWNLSLSATSGPATLTATYIGTYPVAAGTTLPPITITGTLISAAVPSLANSATISTPKDSNAANNTASNTITVVPKPDLTLTKTVPGGTTYQVGGSVTYTLTVSNASGVGPVLTGDAIMVTDSIPTGLTSLTASGTNWTVSLGATTSPTTLTATYTGAYPVNATTSLSTITLSGTLTTTSLPQVVNTAIVTTPNDGNNANNSGSNTLPVLVAPDLTVTDPVPSGTYQVGKPVTYTVTGSSIITGGSVLAGDAITITDTIPAGLTGITATDSTGKWNLSLSATSGPATLTATYIGTYPVTAGTTLPPITITGTLTSAALPNLANSATISTPKDSNAANNTASNLITVIAQPDLTIAKTVPGGIYQVGGPLTYTLTASNAGGAGPVLVGDAIAITDSIPAGLTGMTASGTNWTVSLGATTSPTTLTATYTGAYPVAAGAALPAISLTGTLTKSGLDIAPAPVGYWTFDENSGTIAHDASSNHTNGTLTAGPTWATGEVNSGLSFNGTSNYVTTGNAAAALQFGSSSFTAMAWFKTTNTSGLMRVINQGEGNWNGGFAIDVNAPCAGCVAIVVGGSSAATTLVAGTSTSFADGNWHQAAMVIDRTANTAQLYVDGVAQSLTSLLCGTASGTTVNIAGCSSLTANTADPFVVGAYTGASGTFQYFNGSIDEVRAYNSALSSAQIQTLYSTPPLTNVAVVTTPNDGNIGNNSGSSTISVLPAPDLTVTDPTPSGTTFEVGKPVTYTVTGSSLSSGGSVLAGNAIIITDTIPAGLTGITATDSSGKWNLSLSATSGPATLTATYIGTYPVAAGTTLPPITITGTLTSAAMPNLANTATISTPKDSNAANNTASNTITVVPQPDMTVTKTTAGGTLLQQGSSLTYVITASNVSGAGPVLAGDPITITDAIPIGLTGLTASGTNWTVTLGATTSPTVLTATYTGPYPVAGGTSLAPITLKGTLLATAVPQVLNTAVVTTPNDGNILNNSGTSILPIVLAPDLTVTDPVPSGTFQVGKAVTYTVTGSSLNSGGPVLLGDAITITDTIPAGLTGITATDSSGQWSLSLSATSGPATLTATYIGLLPIVAGTTLPPITITGTLTSAAVPNLVNTATISALVDSNPANNTASNTITVVVKPDMTITKTVPAGTTFQVGKAVTYTLTASDVTGAGPVFTVDAITITDSIPVGLTGITASGTNWTVTLGATTSPTTLTATYTGSYPVAAGTSLAPITLTGTLTTAARPQVINTATVATPNDSNAANNSATNTIPVVLQPDLSLTKGVALAPTSSVSFRLGSMRLS